MSVLAAHVLTLTIHSTHYGPPQREIHHRPIFCSAHQLASSSSPHRAVEASVVCGARSDLCLLLQNAREGRRSGTFIEVQVEDLDNLPAESASDGEHHGLKSPLWPGSPDASARLTHLVKRSGRLERLGG